MRAVRVHETGGPDVIRLDEVAVPEPGPSEVLVRIAAAGLNFIDTYHRSGQYSRDLPMALGVEAAGIVEDVGDAVKDFSEGDRVAYTGVPGAYAEYAAVPQDRLVVVPDRMDLEVAAAAMLQGMTAHYLSHTTYPLSDGETCLIHAAAGGVGHLLVQMAAMRGAHVIATVSTEEKERLAREAGAHDTIRYTEVDFVEEVQRLTDGDGVDVVYDSVGRDTFSGSLDVLRPRGYLVLYGQSSGAVDPIDPQVLNQKGSLFLTRPSLNDYIARPEELRWRSFDLLTWIGDGEIDLRIDRRFALDEAADAHRYMEDRRTKGKVLLVP
jgi:NADPH:quinone reductase